MKNVNETVVTETVITETAEQKIERLTAELKKIKAESKQKKELKGVPVEFKNKAGETIKGNGVMYYVVNLNGKLHYKEASQVTLL